MPCTVEQGKVGSQVLLRDLRLLSQSLWLLWIISAMQQLEQMMGWDLVQVTVPNHDALD